MLYLINMENNKFSIKKEVAETAKEKIIKQKALWDKQHITREREHQDLEDVPNTSAVSIVGYIPKGGTVLEIGPGNGRDARYFIKEKDCKVIAVEFSENAVNQMIGASKKDGTFDRLNTILTDIRDLEAPHVDSVDMFYARSSLHLSDSDIYLLFEKIVPALKIGGYVFIEGKTTQDLKISRSTLIDDNLLEDKDGHLRRSWNSDFIEDFCNKIGIKLIEISDKTEFWQDKEVNFINFLAKKE
jgi:SAM-dependent methyltransferase